jgi:DNA polymerase (family 10)
MARRRLSNAEVARALREMSLFLEMEGVPFKPRAYEKAASAVESLEEPLAAIDAEAGPKGLETVSAVGKGIAAKIDELLRTGRIAKLEALRRKTPVDVLALTAIEGLGPRMVKALYDALGVRSPADLEKACRQGRVRGVPHFGARSEQRMLRAIELQKQFVGRTPISSVLPLAREIAARLGEVPGVVEVAVAGSIRRGKETIGDLDFLVAAEKAAAVAKFFAAMPEVIHVYARGESKTLVRLENGIDADLRAVPLESFGAALAYFTGSKSHNVALRRIARKRQLKLNEYGLFRGAKRIAGRTEEELYSALDLPWIPPELRENRGEIEAAQAGRLPRLIAAGDLRGDLQVHSDWSDGDASLEEMARAARALGLDYIAITDHTRDLSIANGNDEAQLLEQVRAIGKLNRKLRGFRVLTGAEVNIRRDGSLDIADEVLARLDVVGAAIHSHFRLSRQETTRRVIRAMENPHVDVLFHPTGRALGRRAPVALDIDAVIEAARRTGTVLEIDAIPDRLDLKADHVRKAVESGVALVIDSDAHDPSHLGFCDEYGLSVARRGWARKRDVLNTLPADRLLARLGSGRSS